MKILGICGAQGALLHQFRKHLICNVEPRAVFHTKQEEQWKLNFGEIPFVKSIQKIPMVIKKKELDLIIGSPSCGHSSVFSYSRKKTLGKPKEDLTLNLYLRAVKDFLPKMFLLENLPKLMDLIPPYEWEEYFPEYTLVVHCHSVSEFGNSQVNRKRLILIGILKSSEINPKIFKDIFKVNTLKSCRQLEKLIRPHLNFKELGSKKLSMYHPDDKDKKTLTIDQVKDLWMGEFITEYKWPVRTKKMQTLPGVYRNRRDSYPMTLRPANRQFNYRGEVMGMEEFRIIMGFPKRYKVFIDHKALNYWLNKNRNSFTKGSVYEVSKWFKHILKKNNLL